MNLVSFFTVSIKMNIIQTYYKTYIFLNYNKRSVLIGMKYIKLMYLKHIVSYYNFIMTLIDIELSKL